MLKSLVGTLTLTLAIGAQTIDHKTLTLDGARKAITAAKAQAEKNKASGVIAVVDAGGNLIALERLDGTFAAGSTVAIGKARTAALFQKPTRFFEDVIAKGRFAMTALPDFTPLAGGVPIVVDGQTVGAVGVSGANSAAQDEEFALAAAAAVPMMPHVVYFERRRVDEAFAKGEVLLNDGSNYMVHASRRSEAGMAEVHTHDADIVHVLEGTATLVTGGAAVSAKTIAPGEIRGSHIDGGEERKLSKGDVIVVPAGVPHWFKTVSDPFLYYVVKAR